MTNKIVIAYAVQILLFIASGGSYFYGDKANVIVQIIYVFAIIPTAFLIISDAKQRGIPKYHGWWAVLGIIGVLIYHFGFARKTQASE